jgi:hypothetical protein
MPLAFMQVRFYGLCPYLSCLTGPANPRVKPRYTTGSQQATGPVSPESWPTSLASIGHCGGVQHRELTSAGETTGGACGGTLTGNHRCAQVRVSPGHVAERRASEARSSPRA